MIQDFLPEIFCTREYSAEGEGPVFFPWLHQSWARSAVVLFNPPGTNLQYVSIIFLLISYFCYFIIIARIHILYFIITCSVKLLTYSTIYCTSDVQCICYSWSFDVEEVILMLKMSSLIRLWNIDYQPCNCEHGLCTAVGRIQPILEIKRSTALNIGLTVLISNCSWNFSPHFWIESEAYKARLILHG